MNDTDLIKKHRTATNKLILLDYDGTLVPFAMRPEKAKPSETLLQILRKLANTSGTKVIIITGRAHHDIGNFLGNLPVNIIAEHGAMIKENGKWRQENSDNCSWKKEILPVLNEISAEAKDSFIEEKNFSLSWHYRNMEPISGYIYSRELIRMTTAKSDALDLRILDGNKVVEIMKNQTGKGKAVMQLLQKGNYDFVLAIGDDATDEDMFKVLSDNENYFTIKVGYGKTCAKYKLSNVQQVIFFLQRL